MEQRGDDGVDVLAAVVGAELDHQEEKFEEEFFQEGREESLDDTLDCADEFPLRHLVDQVDMVDAIFALPVALMHRIYANITRFPSGIGFRLLPIMTGVGLVFRKVDACETYCLLSRRL